VTKQDLNTRRAKIIRRWAAFRISRAQREIWRKRRARAGAPNAIDENTDVAYDLLAELPDGLLG
jgi:hypothetical protein